MASTLPNSAEQKLPLLKRQTVVRLLLVALLAEIGYAALNLSTMPIYLRNDRGIGESVIGLILVAFLLSEAIFKSPMGHLADKFGPKTFMILGPAISGGTSLLTLFVPHTGGSTLEVLAFLVLRIFDGLAAAMLWPAAFSAMNEAVEDGERQQAMSLLNLCYMLGVALAFPVGGIANDVFRVKWAGLVLAASLFVAVSIVVWRLIPRPSPSGSGAEVHQEATLADFFTSMRQIPTYLILAVVTFAGIGFPLAIFKFFPKDEFSFSETMIGLLILPGAIAMALMSVPMSKLGERIGRARAVHLGLGLCTLGIALIGSGMLLPFMRSPWVLAIAAAPVGIGFLLTIPAWMASVSDIDPTRRATNIGAVMTAQGLGAIIGAPIGSTMYEKLQPVGVQIGLGESFGRYAPFAGCAACVLIGWLLSLRILKDPR